MGIFPQRNKFYDGTQGRGLVDCPDCALPADAAFGDHGGECRSMPPAGRRAMSALDLIKRYAEKHQFLSINDLRAEMDAEGVQDSTRGPAFGAACRAGVIRKVGHATSSDPGTKGAEVKTYRSLRYSGAATQEEEGIGA
jgi:hypothetical protein